METVRLVAHRRSETGKGPARRLRGIGQVPAVLYGHGASEAIAVDSKELLLIRRSESGANTIIDLAIDGAAEGCNAILREVQIDPISRQQLHADFYRVAMDEPIDVTVPLAFINEPDDRFKAALAFISYIMHDLAVRCLPRNIPDTITVDLQEFEVGTTLTAGDIPMPSGVTLVTHAEEAVVTTESAVVREAEEAEVGEEAAAPGAEAAAETEEASAE
jgi:large subunit ribosomal protein L25